MKTKAIEELIRQEKNEYFKKWRKNNPDKIKEINRRYWEKKALERLKAEKEAEVEK